MGTFSAIRAAFGRLDDPYAGGDIELSRKLGRLLAGATTVIGVILIPLAPPTKALGSQGWLLVVPIVVLSVVSVVSERAVAEGFNWNHILFWNYVGILQIATAQWLAGATAPYRQLFLFSAVYVGGVHPPRRVLTFLMVTAGVTIAPVFYEPWDPMFFGSTISLVLIWSALALVASITMLKSRRDRVGGQQAERLARRDPLTGLGNRFAFDEALAEEIARARRIGSPLSLLLGDLNDFKEINDTYGHLAGDHCLRQVAAAFRDEIRLHDRCFRWGGDEFAAVLGDSDAAVADLIAERVEETVRERCRRPDGAPLTIEVAHAELSDGMTAEDLLGSTDTELMAAKARR